MVVDGGAAAALGDLARRRWELATGKRQSPARHDSHGLWPEGVEPDFRDIQVGIARTVPAHDGDDEVREVEQLWLDAIGAARRWIYCESQYFTSAAIAGALVRRLREENGPEIVLVAPRVTRGWLEQQTMDVLRSRFIGKLRDADLHHRLSICYPRLDDNDEEDLMVHSKLLVADDRLLRIGSSNVSNRSMGLDTEADLVVEAEEPSEHSRRIASVRNRLLAEHLDCREEEFAEALESTRSLVSAVERLRGTGRSLADIDGSVPEALDKLLPEEALFDPERPLDLDDLSTWNLAERSNGSARKRRLWGASAGLAALLVLAASWRWTPLGELLDRDSLLAGFAWLRNQSLTPLLVLGAYLVGGLLVFPLSLLIVATGMVFGPLTGLSYALAGSLLSAAAMFMLGRGLGRRTLRDLAGTRLLRASRGMARQGVLAVFALRLVPVAPFTVVNLVLGASHLRFRDYLLGTALGLLPGIIAVTLLGDRLAELIRDPGPWTIVSAVALLLASITLIVLLRRRFARKTGRNDVE
jgi:uncharacterized membrane protein YdjX (TVP38/TMEM64 family)